MCVISPSPVMTWFPLLSIVEKEPTQLDVLIVFLGLLVTAAGAFILAHLRPLTQPEISQLATKRRNKGVQAYFTFTPEVLTVDANLKKRLNPKGKFYSVGISLADFPSWAAALLKGKKHEWVVFGFERLKTINSLWANKGPDRTVVIMDLSPEEAVEVAIEDKSTSVLICHNHPNVDPRHLDCSQPSDKDVESAQKYAQVLNRKGLNLIEWVCERGRHHEYFFSPADSFLPVRQFVETVEAANGRSKLTNLSLHLERLSDSFATVAVVAGQVLGALLIIALLIGAAWLAWQMAKLLLALLVLWFLSRILK